jgi:hypothetical protein
MKHFILAAGFACLGAAHAGHEFPFYPSFYPQEITVEALDAQAAAQRLAAGTLHAYAGADIAATADRAKIGTVSALGGYLVATFERGAQAPADRSARCAAARGLKDRFAGKYVWHPYPVTPFHADYLHHADRAEAARAAVAAQNSASLRAGGKLEVIDVAALEARAGARFIGWSGPPWRRQGWFHAYLLLAPAVSDGAVRARIEDAVRRLTHGDYRSIEERINLERGLVAQLQGGCERVVLGYTERREHYGKEYSQGVENVGYDALEGIASAIFPRTVKLRDFPWNGWLHVAGPAAPADAWNPVVGGFGDAFGRFVWWAIADPAFLPSPHGGGWIENRVNVSAQQNGPSLAVPEDALLPEPGSGRLLPVGRGKTDASQFVYRVRNSAFHDGTSMTAADLLYPYAFAAAWSAGAAADPGVARATARARARLKGVRVVRVETETLASGEDKLTYEVPVIEVYLDAESGADAATVAPPWTTLPWHLLALFEEGARRGYFRLSDFDPVRDTALVRRLAGLAGELEERAHVPAALAPYASAAEARARYRRLREFHAAHGHWLVTNGPYLLDRWDGKTARLRVFRDPSYPKGLGSFNDYAVPLKAYVTQIEHRAYGAEVQTETEWLERLGRDVRIVRGTFAAKLAERITGAGTLPAPVCHYLLIGPDGAVAGAGEARAGGTGACRLEFGRAGGRRGPGGHRLVVASVLKDHVANAPIRIVPWDH